VTDPELVQRARNAGIAAEYYNWRGQYVAVPEETLAAILRVLEQSPEPDSASGAGSSTTAPQARGSQSGASGSGGSQCGDSASGGSQAGASASAGESQSAESASGSQAGASASGGWQAGESASGGSKADDSASAAGSSAPRLSIPAQRQWGFTVQLYSLRSKESWGHGDLHDLAKLVRWSATELGAGFVLINPLHAAEPLPPISPSPYLPMTRMFTSPLYLRVEDVLEYGALPAEDKRTIHEIAVPLRAANATADLIDRDAVWRGKRVALELISKVPLTESRQHAYAAFRAERGRDLERWSTWCALAEAHGPDWREWPAELADPARAADVVAGDEKLSRAAEFHGWLQWQADEQLAAAQDAARAAGMAYGIIQDLAIGAHPGGADAWSNQRLLAAGFSVGAPPDGFNQLGQDWSQPPWNPRALAAVGYQPIAELFGVSLRHAGGLRVDHVMGMMRLWWVPVGQPPDRGAYVSYDHRASVGALLCAAARAGAVAVGEDLGTVDPWIREYLAEQGILGTMMLWFAHAGDGTPMRPPDWRRDCMATVGTHDVPPVFGFVTGDQVTVRARLGLLKTSEEQERSESEAMLARWQAALVSEGLLSADRQPDPAEYTVALYGYLRKTPAVLLGVSLADAVGDRRTQNIPGTRDEYPNWRIPLCDDTGRPVLLEELPGIGLLRAVCQAVSPALASQRSVRGRSG
jgi:4-alpha-glucanotransferase